MVKAISGVLTVRFKNELERNITIKLGYANAKVIVFTGLQERPAHDTFNRSINVRMKSALGRDATVPIALTRRSGHLASDQAAGVG